MTVSQGSGTIQRLCRQAGVSRAGYYRHWQKSAPRAHDTALRALIHDVAMADKRKHGYRYISEELWRQHGLIINRKRVLRLMREDNLLCLRRKPFVPPTTDSRHKWRIVPNLVKGLELTGLDQLWVADITYTACRSSSPTSRW
jgi:putative transposase